MSFILDALKKAESERSRASGPVLVDVRIAPPRRRLPAWAWALGGVLLANLAVLAWLVLRKPAVEIATVAAPAAVPAAATVPAATALAAAPVPASQPAAVSLELTPLAAPVVTSPAPAAAAPVLNGPPADVDQLPSYREIQAAGVTLPALTMNLHVYDPAPAQRYVLLNGLHLTQGEFTPDGIKVEVITERGVVLEARGRRFLLPSGG
jgi:general secretion pathway protein B